MAREYSSGEAMKEGVTFFAMALIGLVLACVYIESQGGNPFASAHSPVSQGATGNSIVGGPSLSAAKIDAILSSAGSPAAGTGNVFTLDSAQYNIDDAYALAFFHHESTYGLYGAA